MDSWFGKINLGLGISMTVNSSTTSHHVTLGENLNSFDMRVLYIYELGWIMASLWSLLYHWYVVALLSGMTNSHSLICTPKET